MSKEIAEQKYAKGVVYKPISATNRLIPDRVSSGNIVGGESTIWESCFDGFVYLDGKWAEIVQPSIIGYKLIKPEYEEAALKLVNLNSNRLKCMLEFMEDPNSWTLQTLKKAGVLDLWFEPVIFAAEEKRL